MVKIFFINLLFFTCISGGIIFISSCKKCATCTYEDKAGVQDTSDYCGKGNPYKDWLDRHEKSGWKCTEE